MYSTRGKLTEALRLLLLFGFPVTAALGSFLLPLRFGGVTLYAFRVEVLLVAFLLPLLSQKQRWWRNRIARFYISLGGFWIIYSLLSTFWARDLGLALRDVAAVSFGFFLALEFLSLRSDTPNGIWALLNGWVCAYAITTMVAIWEISTGKHLASSFSSDALARIGSDVVFATFGNPNNYGAFLVLSLPFLLGAYLLSRSRYYRAFLLFLLLSAPLLVTKTASRLSSAAFIVETFVFLFLHATRGKKSKRKFSFIAVLPAFIFLIALTLFYAEKPGTYLHYKLSSVSKEISEGGSVRVRLHLAIDGIWMLLNTAGMGVGAGNFEVIMLNETPPYPTHGIINPHNFWIEILSEYGIITFSLFLVWYLTLLRYFAKHIARISSSVGLVLSKAAVSGLLAYLLVAMANSSFMLDPINWTFLASMVSIAVLVGDLK